MKIIREHDNESPERICHVLKVAPYSGDVAQEDVIVAIDEEYLAWFYVAPGEPLSQTSLEMLAFARELIGCGAWVVLQAHNDTSQPLLNGIGLRIVESYHDEGNDPESVSVHVVQAVPMGPTSV